MAKTPLTQEELKRVLHYDPETGIFTWRVSRRGNAGKAKPGNRAGALQHKGYRQIGIYGVLYAEHRLAWLYITGSWPKHEIDHKNRIGTDNRWINLRDVTHAKNSRNVGIKDSNTSGIVGADLQTRKKGYSWRATIRAGGQKIHLGTFKTLQEAKHAYQAAAIAREELDND